MESDVHQAWVQALAASILPSAAAAVIGLHPAFPADCFLATHAAASASHVVVLNEHFIYLTTRAAARADRAPHPSDVVAVWKRSDLLHTEWPDEEAEASSAEDWARNLVVPSACWTAAGEQDRDPAAAVRREVGRLIEAKADDWVATHKYIRDRAAINAGRCADFAEDIQAILDDTFSGVEARLAYSDEELSAIGCHSDMIHVALCVGGEYFDSEAPGEVRNFTELAFWQEYASSILPRR